MDAEKRAESCGARFFVTDEPFGAKADGMTNDREAIQRAVDAAWCEGGGEVVLPGGKTCLTGNIVLRSGVTLFFEDGAVLLQSPDPGDYVKPSADGALVPYRPEYGYNWSSEIRWSHLWYRNYPFLYAPEGSHDFAVRGRGTIRMMEVGEPDKLLRVCPIGFYRCRSWEIADVRITNYHSYAMMPFTCEHGIVRNVTIDGANHGNGDGICLMNCRHIRVTGCTMMTGDDSIYIFSSCRDPRKSEWWSSDEPEPSVDIEIDHNDLRSDHCKAFGMILWGLNCEDQEKVEVRHVRVHDNHIETMGNWLYNPYTDKAGFPPVTDVRFENNIIDGIEANFFETQISDMNVFRSMRQMKNGDFSDGRCFWSATEGSAGVCRDPEEPYGYVGASGTDRSAMYQGLWLEEGVPYLFRAEVRGEALLFVRDLDTGGLIARHPFDYPAWEDVSLSFRVPRSGNYHVGLESENGVYAAVKNAAFGGSVDAEGCGSVIFDRGKIIYQYNDDLFRR